MTGRDVSCSVFGHNVCVWMKWTLHSWQSASWMWSLTRYSSTWSPMSSRYSSSRVGSQVSHSLLWASLQLHTHTHTRLMAVWAGWASTRKVKPIWILLKQETVSGSGISWAICKFTPDRQLCQHPTTQFFTARMPLLPPNQQHQSAEGSEKWSSVKALQLIMW